MGQKARPVQLTKVVVQIERGTKIGTVATGWSCTPTGRTLTWKGGRRCLDTYELNEVIREEFESANYTVVGDPDALFDDPSSWKAEFLIGALISDIDLSICYQYIGKAKGKMYMKVDWQIYSRLDRKVVYKTTSVGTFEIGEPRAGTYGDLFVYAFGAATRSLLADQKFFALLSTEATMAASKTKFDKLFIIRKAPFNSQIENSIDDVRMGVVTVFAGDTHGSGFVIDESGYILTSAHVVG